MSRQHIPFADGTLLVLGYDAPFNTWYAIHYDDLNENKAPRVAIGYHPAEQVLLRAERPTAIIGPYPVTDAEVLVTDLIPKLMGLEAEPEQTMCLYCGVPPWKPGPETCPDHPWNRLRYG